MLGQQGQALDAVIALTVDPAALLERIRTRIQESVTTRSDDTQETLLERLKVYDRQTAPILPYYEARGLLHRLDGMASIEGVAAAIDEVLERQELQRQERLDQRA